MPIHDSSLRIYVFAPSYPSAYKPYYDAQFAEMLDQGHDLTIFARDRISKVHGGLVAAYDLTARTRYLLSDGKRAAVRLVPNLTARATLRPSLTWRRVRQAASRGEGLKNRVQHAIRAAVLPARAPDLCLVHEHETMLMIPWLKDAYPGIPIALYHHGGRPPEAGRLNPRRVRQAFAAASIVFTNTEAARVEAIAIGSPGDATKIVPVGFRLSLFDGTRLPGGYRPGGCLRLVSAGRLSEGKGHAVALLALARLVRDGSNVHYEIIGTGPMQPELQALVETHGLQSHVTFSGSMAHEALLARLQAADVLILPSIPTATTSETQGAVMQEALLQGCLVSASRLGGIPESLPPFLHELLFEPGDDAGLADRVRSIMDMDDSEICTLAHRGRRWVEGRYDNTVLVPRLINEILQA